MVATNEEGKQYQIFQNFHYLFSMLLNSSDFFETLMCYVLFQNDIEQFLGFAQRNYRDFNGSKET
jgi:hypothetical protein